MDTLFSYEGVLASGQLRSLRKRKLLAEPET
jgi:hypothetical protein